MKKNRTTRSGKARRSKNARGGFGASVLPDEGVALTVGFETERGVARFRLVMNTADFTEASLGRGPLWMHGG